MYSQQNYSQQQQPGPPGYSSAAPAGQWNNSQGNSGQQSGGQWGNQPYQQQTQSSQPPQMAEADRPLPHGWIRQWNEQYRSWFFVNTLAQPPVSQWTHPNVLPPPNGPPPAGYCTPPAPAGQPPAFQDQRGFFGAGTPPQAPAGYQSGGGPPAGYGANPASGYAPAAPTGYAPAAPVATKNASAPAKKAGMSGLMGAGLGAAGGLALGAFASHEWHEHERREDRREEQAYNAGHYQGEHQRQGQSEHGGGYSGGYGEEPQDSYTTTTTHREVHNADGSWYEEDETTEVEDDDGW